MTSKVNHLGRPLLGAVGVTSINARGQMIGTYGSHGVLLEAVRRERRLALLRGAAPEETVLMPPRRAW